MIDVGGTILQMSVIALTVAVKGHQEGIVQQQIKTVGLRQWLSLAVAWIVNWIYAETSSLREFISPPPPTLCLKLVAVKRAVPTKLSVLKRSILTARLLADVRDGSRATFSNVHITSALLFITDSERTSR
jgi:hypothetical protein